MELPKKYFYEGIDCFTLILGPKQLNCVFSDLLDNLLQILDDDKVPQSDKKKIYRVSSNSLFYEQLGHLISFVGPKQSNQIFRNQY